MTSKQFADWIKREGLNISSVARIFETERRTVQRWVHQKASVSRIVELACLAISAGLHKGKR